jgi:hypothetical protein
MRMHRSRVRCSGELTKSDESCLRSSGQQLSIAENHGPTDEIYF